MFLSIFVAALALQAPAPKPAPKPAAKPAPAPAAPAAPAPKAEKTEKTEKAEGNRWIADYDQAVEVARKEGKDLLVDFTGSDWCGWCIKLHKEVFDFDSFLDAAEESYVLVSLDFPNTEPVKKLVPNPARNAELAKKYQIQGYPTVLLMTADGEVFGKTGYKDGGPDKYVEHVKSLTTNGKKALVEVAAISKDYAAAKGPAQEKLLDQAIALLASQEEGSPFSSKLAPIVRDAFKNDPDNKKGRKIKAVEALLKAGEIDDATSAAAKTLDPKNEKGLIERVVMAQASSVGSKEQVVAALKAVDDLVATGPIKDKETAKQLYANAAFWCKQVVEDPAKAKVYAQKLKDLGVDDNPNLKRLVDDILGS